MLNEEKIKLMTGIAMFEKKEGKKIFPLNRYFKSDYISRRMFGSFFGYTLCCCLGAVLWVLYHLEQYLNSLQADLLLDLAKKFILFYLAGLILYLLITYLVCRRRYEYASGGLRIYIAKLKRLEKRYEQQSRAREITKEDIIRHDGSSGL